MLYLGDNPTRLLPHLGMCHVARSAVLVACDDICTEIVTYNQFGSIVMPRRLFVVFIVALSVGLWMPAQSTIAQTDCPEGVCKVFLPAVFTQDHMRVIEWYVGAGRYCSNPTLTVLLQNTGQNRVTEFRVRGYIILDTDERVEYDRVFTDQAVYPGGWVAVHMPVPDCMYAREGLLQVSDFVVDQTPIASLNVLSSDKQGGYDCYGSGRFTVSGNLRNDTTETLSVLAVQFGIYGTGQVRDNILAPGETTVYTGTFELKYDRLGCDEPTYYPRFTVQAWGEPIR